MFNRSLKLCRYGLSNSQEAAVLNAKRSCLCVCQCVCLKSGVFDTRNARVACSDSDLNRNFLRTKKLYCRKQKYLENFYFNFLGVKTVTKQFRKDFNKSFFIFNFVSFSITSLSESFDWSQILFDWSQILFDLWFLIIRNICIVFPVPWMIKLKNENSTWIRDVQLLCKLSK